MTTHYRWTHAVATGLACGAVGYQSAVIWEMLSGVSTVTKIGVPLATITAAMLPVLAEAAWRAREKTKAVLMALPVVALLAFELPSCVSRLGEVQEARINASVMSGEDRARILADLNRSEKLVAQAEQWTATECASGAGTKCQGQRFILEQRTAYRDKLRTDLAGTGTVASPWLPAWHPALLPIGLTLAIVTLLSYGLGPLIVVRESAVNATIGTGSGGTARPEQAKPKAPAGITERDFTIDPITDEEIEEIKRVLGRDGLMNRELAKRLGCSEGQSTKIVAAAIEAGKLSKVTDPADRRKVIIRALEAA